MRYKHFLLTRFSYPPEYPHLEERIDLFKKYTLPSVRKQRNQNFRWLIQSKNPEWFEGIDCEVVDLKSMEEILNGHKSKWTITSRMDNDDILHPDFIRNIQANFEPQEMVIDFKGYRYNLSTGKAVKFDIYGPDKPSPFISLIQKSGNIGRGVMNHVHGQIHESFPVRQIPDRLWIQVIHPTNKLMKWKGSDKFEEVKREDLWI